MAAELTIIATERQRRGRIMHYLFAICGGGALTLFLLILFQSG